MNSITRNIIFIGALWLAGCASGPVQNVAGPSAPAPQLPTYDEKIRSVSLEQIKATCPADGKWESLEWKKITPYASACVKAKDWQKVEKMGNFLATHASLTPWGAYYLSLAAEGRKDYPRAIWMLELALKKDPTEGIFQYELGRIYWDQGDDGAAIKHLQTASDLNPSLTDCHWVMGQIAVMRHDYAQAERYYTKALNSNSKHLPTILSFASLKLNEKDYAKAEDFLLQAVDLAPHNAKARINLAQVQEQHLQKQQEALRNYKQIKQLSADKKLDEPVHVDDKIHNLEKSLSQAEKTGQVTARTPSGQGKEKQ